MKHYRLSIPPHEWLFEDVRMKVSIWAYHCMDDFLKMLEWKLVSKHATKTLMDTTNEGINLPALHFLYTILCVRHPSISMPLSSSMSTRILIPDVVLHRPQSPAPYRQSETNRGGEGSFLYIWAVLPWFAMIISMIFANVSLNSMTCDFLDILRSPSFHYIKIFKKK